MGFYTSWENTNRKLWFTAGPGDPGGPGGGSSGVGGDGGTGDGGYGPSMGLGIGNPGSYGGSNFSATVASDGTIGPYSDANLNLAYANMDADAQHALFVQGEEARTQEAIGSLIGTIARALGIAGTVSAMAGFIPGAVVLSGMSSVGRIVSSGFNIASAMNMDAVNQALGMPVTGQLAHATSIANIGSSALGLAGSLTGTQALGQIGRLAGYASMGMNALGRANAYATSHGVTTTGTNDAVSGQLSIAGRRGSVGSLQERAKAATDFNYEEIYRKALRGDTKAIEQIEGVLGTLHAAGGQVDLRGKEKQLLDEMLDVYTKATRRTN